MLRRMKAGPVTLAARDPEAGAERTRWVALIVCSSLAIIWARPDWGLFVAATATGLLAWGGQARDWRLLGSALGIGVLLLLKDRVPSLAAEHWQWIGALPGGVPVSAARQPNWAAGLSGAIAFVLCLWLMGVLRARLADRTTARDVSVFMVLAGVGLCAWIGLQPGGAAGYGERFAFAPLPSRNAVACALAMVTLLAGGVCWNAWASRAALPSALGLGAALISGWTALALGSRGAWLALAVGAAVLAVSSRRVRWAGSAVALAVGTVVWSILWLQPQAAVRVGELGSEFRVEIWRGAFRAWQEFPWLGGGASMFGPLFSWGAGVHPPLGATFVHPDSSWVLLFFELGALGVVAFGGAVWVGWRGAGEIAATGGEARALRRGARAAVMAWLVAAMFDISLHRAPLLALGVPLIGLGWPVRVGRISRWPGILLAALALGIALFAVLDGDPVSRLDGAACRMEGGRARLSPQAARLLAEHPLDVSLHHRCGADAVRLGSTALAVRHWTMVVSLRPAAEEGTWAYARAVQVLSPRDALPLWRHLFEHAEERATARLEAALKEFGRDDLGFWRQALGRREDLWVVLADDGRPEAERCFEDWLRQPVQNRVRVPLAAVTRAHVRWGTATEFRRWISVAPRWNWREGLAVAQATVQQGRVDLAWCVLDRMVRRPEMPTMTPQSANATSARRPSDYARLAEWLKDGRIGAARRLEVLAETVQRPDCPAWFHVVFAYLLFDLDRRAEAVDRLMQAAEKMTPAQPADW